MKTYTAKNRYGLCTKLAKFNTETEAINQLIAWKNELEARGFYLARFSEASCTMILRRSDLPRYHELSISC